MPEEIYHVITSLENTCPGLHNIPTSKIKLVAHHLSGVLASIINNILKNGVFPKQLKRGKVVPVFKKGDPSLMANYRPITILPFFQQAN